MTTLRRGGPPRCEAGPCSECGPYPPPAFQPSAGASKAVQLRHFLESHHFAEDLVAFAGEDDSEDSEPAKLGIESWYVCKHCEAWIEDLPDSPAEPVAALTVSGDPRAPWAAHQIKCPDQNHDGLELRDQDGRPLAVVYVLANPDGKAVAKMLETAGEAFALLLQLAPAQGAAREVLTKAGLLAPKKRRQ